MNKVTLLILVIPVIFKLIFIRSIGASVNVKSENHSSEFPAANSHQDFSDLNQTFYQQKNEIFQLRAAINGLENQLGKINLKYLTKIEINKKLNMQITQLKEQLEKSREFVNEHYNKVKKTYHQIVLQKIAPYKQPEDLYIDQFLVKELKSKLDFLKLRLDENKELRDQLAKIELDLTAQSQIEVELQQLSVRLESKKKNLAEKYLFELDRQNLVEKKLETVKNQVKRDSEIEKSLAVSRLNSALPIELARPISLSWKQVPKDKGVNFYFKETSEVKAPASGVVAYSGSLANIGRVIMIDHGQNIRSVILGDFAPELKKGTVVSAGQRMGYTSKLKSASGKIYFEIRKDNQILDLSSWLEKTSL
jgi:murein DD-endopeptidase MepM/ murein hydrolase activator NlpD